MKFDSSLIVPPSQNYKGLSYGEWAVIFWNWLFSNQTQSGPVYFLRGNVDNEPAIVKKENSEVMIFSDRGVFFPIICTIYSKLNHPTITNSIERRKNAADSQKHPKLLRAKIDNSVISDLRRYYAETPEFTVDISKYNILRMKFDPPIPPGKAPAVSAGYWLLVKSLPVGKHRIEFEGIHKDGFRTFGQYTLNVRRSLVNQL
ncbi:MAG: hypothetical protein ACHQ1D_02455 [Nitrososphaerales archaeon]